MKGTQQLPILVSKEGGLERILLKRAGLASDSAKPERRLDPPRRDKRPSEIPP